MQRNFPVSSRITIKQVAREAGVSTQTISRVINDHPDVSPETRRRVREIVARLGYHPNAIARSLSRQRTHTLGVVASGLEYYGPSRTVIGIDRQASELGYALLLSLLHDPASTEVQQVIQGLLAHQVEGIIWTVPEIDRNHDWLRQTQSSLPVPLLCLSAQAAPGLPVIAIDNRQGGRLATEHLLSSGYRHIGLIAGPLSWWEARERRLGWQDALSSHGILPLDQQLVEGDWTAASGAGALHKLRQQFPAMDAVFACNDQMALGALRAAQLLGLTVPADVAVVGFDDRPEAAFFSPPLATVRQQVQEMGGLAVRELHRLIEAAHRGEAASAGGSISLQPELVVRASACAKVMSDG